MPLCDGQEPIDVAEQLLVKVLLKVSTPVIPKHLYQGKNKPLRTSRGTCIIITEMLSIEWIQLSKGSCNNNRTRTYCYQNM